MKVGILGSTGSVGSQALDVIRKYKDQIKVQLLGASKLSENLINQIKEFKPSYVYVENTEEKSIDDTKVLIGEDGLKQAVSLDLDLFINAIAGIKGILPTYLLLKYNKTLATANKEAIICLGELLKDKYKKILPIDSEHSAIFQILKDSNQKEIRRIILTASGGPFVNMPAEDFENITVKQALIHPRWSMGKKITIDSATLMNKGLEVIEAHYLFSMPYEKIDVLIHPESIIHGMVEFVDGTVISNMSYPDMKIPISYALFYPERRFISDNYLDFTKIKSLNFLKPDTEKFPLLKLAVECGKKGGVYPTVLTVADEIAVNYFLEERIKFTDIHKIILETLEKFDYNKLDSVDDVFYIIDKTINLATEIAKKYGST
ncbi:1-deoxy-D-xylulose-5-phosphate reductoisomerase [Sulfurihydrogenibium sp.]|uniref:1-deoxy-D-xylulose-5-phosphate reductoisomerase n=1 Tax=Sulfurihydrogenibium sp. TaxID=2053621 RepID=UPI0026052E81|nr:1-deoxy-D-xylulose-5-phosphate reductoisomerase [Sulfurihydrogenibium sp.]